MERSLDLWLPSYMSAREGETVEDPVLLCPLSYQSRLTTSKLLIELSLWNQASEVFFAVLTFSKVEYGGFMILTSRF